jgi:hypothetical protein
MKATLKKMFGAEQRQGISISAFGLHILIMSCRNLMPHTLKNKKIITNIQYNTSEDSYGWCYI